MILIIIKFGMFCFEFLQELIMFEKLFISNTQKIVSSNFFKPPLSVWKLDETFFLVA